MTKYVQRKFYYISLNLGPAAGPAQAITIALQLPIIETRVTILLGLARADGPYSFHFHISYRCKVALPKLWLAQARIGINQRVNS